MMGPTTYRAVRRVFREVDPAAMGTGFPPDEYDDVADRVFACRATCVSARAAVECARVVFEQDWEIELTDAKAGQLEEALTTLGFTT